MIAGARNVVFFNGKRSWRAQKVRTDGFMLGMLSVYARIILRSGSDRPRIVNDVSPVFGHFL